jgi:predicted regulator of Ras-like GTPase activity (Roadblock/LC7/MglB family)
MNLKESLKKISEKVDDFIGIAIAAADGIIVEEHRTDSSFDLTSVVAECGALWKTAEKASQSVELGSSQEMTIVTERAVVLVKKINPGYFLLLAVASEKNFGKGRFLLRMEADTLVEELS